MTTTTHTHIPNQDIIFEPYSQKFYSYYDHNDAILKYYISPEFGNFTRILGENTILEGLTISNVSHTVDSISCTIDKGRMIIDRTYIEIESDDVITYEHANSFADSGYFVLSVRFNNQNILRANKATYHLTYFTATNLPHSDFDSTENLIILGIFSFTNTDSEISDFNLLDFDPNEIITLDGVETTIRNVEVNANNSLLDGGVINFSDVDISGDNNVFDMVNLLKSLRPNTITSTYIDTPVNVSPGNLAINVTETPTLFSDAFECINGSDIHLNSDWEIYSNSGLSTLEWSSYNDISNKITIVVPDGELSEGTIDYWWRCRHTGTTYGTSVWSVATEFNTINIYIDTPVNVSPTNLATDITETPTLSSDAFECINGSDTHLNSDWEIYSDIGLSTLLWSSYTDATNKVSIAVPAGNLLEGATDYWWRCKHTGTTYGASAWSTTTKFTTETLFTYVDTPVNVSPINSATEIVLTPALETSVFATVGQTDTLNQKEYMIQKVSDDSVVYNPTV